MAIKSPTDIVDPTVSITVKVNGAPVNDTYPLLSVKVMHEANRISIADIVFSDGSAAIADFPISNSSDFIPGNTIEIFAGYGDAGGSSIYKGKVAKQIISIDGNNTPQLIVRCRGAAELKIKKPAYATKPVLRVAYGESIIAFEAELTTAVTGSVTYQGNADAMPGSVIELAGVGNRFNGNVIVAAITHIIEEGNWKTTTGFARP